MHRPSRRLLLVVNQIAPIGGAEVQLLHLAKGLAALGHAVTLCCVDSSTLPASALDGTGVELVELKARRREARPLAIPRLIRLARRADVVHCTMWDPSLWGRIAAILARRPVVVADHATDRSIQVATSGSPRARWIALHNRLLDRFTFATVACATSQLAVLASEGVAPEKTVHIPNGIPVEDLRRAGEAAPSRAQLGLPESVPLVVLLGIFRPEKNQLGGLEAVRLLRERVPDAEIAFVGDGPTRAEVEARGREIGAEAWAHFLGRRADVPALLARADLLMLSSISDAMPMAVLEAMAVGLPTVATDVGDIARVLEGRAGVCVPVDDPSALATACADLLLDPARRGKMGEAASAIAPHFDASTMVERYDALLSAAVAGTSPRLALDEGGSDSSSSSSPPSPDIRPSAARP